MNLRILTLLALIDNFYQYRVAFKSYQSIYAFFNSTFSKSSIRAQISAANQSGEAEKILKNGQVYFSLTSKGWKVVTSLFLRPYRALPTRWDGKWRMIIFNVPESQRDARGKLRSLLKKQGFGKLSNSCYVSPFISLKKTLAEANLEFFAFEAISGTGDQKIAATAFNLFNLAKLYNKWIKKTKLTSSVKEEFEVIMEYYDIVFRVDPALPEELLPEHWPFSRSWSIFIGLVNKRLKLSAKKTGINSS